MNSPRCLSHYLTVLCLLLLLFTGCGGCGDQQSAGPEIAFKHQDNTVRIRLPAEPTALNPYLSTQGYSRYITELMFQSLVDFDPETLELLPLLATADPVIETIDLDGREVVDYTYEIRPEARWDNGSPITAADLAFTLKCIFNPAVNAAPYRGFYDMIESFTPDPANERRFTIRTNRPYILTEPALGSLGPYPAYRYDPEGLLSGIEVNDLLAAKEGDPILADERLTRFAELMNSADYAREGTIVGGSGPYHLVSWSTGERVILERKKDWWGDQLDNKLLKAYPDTVIFEIIPDQVTASNALKDEQLDVAIELDIEQFMAMRDNAFVTERYDLVTEEAYNYYFISINEDKPALSDPTTRRALAHVLDIDALIEDIYQGMATRLNGPFLPSKPYYDTSLEPIAFDPDRAATLLTEAGWTDSDGDGVLDRQMDGRKVNLEIEFLAFTGSSFSEKLALFIQDGARQAGIKVNIISQEASTAFADVKNGDYDLFGAGFGSEPLPDDPYQVWSTASFPPNGSNRSRFGNAESDSLINRIRTTLDPAERAPLYKKFQRMVYDDQPMIFLFVPQVRLAISKRFDYKTTSLTPGVKVNMMRRRE